MVVSGEIGMFVFLPDTRFSPDARLKIMEDT